MNKMSFPNCTAATGTAAATVKSSYYTTFVFSERAAFSCFFEKEATSNLSAYIKHFVNVSPHLLHTSLPLLPAAFLPRKTTKSHSTNDTVVPNHSDMKQPKVTMNKATTN